MPPLLVLITGLPGTGKTTLANRIAEMLSAPVLGHDWTLRGLRPFPELQTVIERMDRVTARSVGWSVMLSIARAQPRSGRSVVLDGVARIGQVERTRSVAAEEGVSALVVLVDCPHRDIHRGRVEGRTRGIPNW